MKNTTAQFGLFAFVLLAISLSGCASAVDDASPLPEEDGTASASQPITNVAAATGDALLDADAADCDAVAQGDPYEELASILESSSINLDGSPEVAGNTCTRVCKCCKRGNRFCCSHCRFCSGPIGVSGGVLSR